MEQTMIIKKLERMTGKRLRQLDIADIPLADNGYVVDKKRNIVGLNLCDAKLKDISFLKDFPHLTYRAMGTGK
jgi:hypothetical protein